MIDKQQSKGKMFLRVVSQIVLFFLPLIVFVFSVQIADKKFLDSHIIAVIVFGLLCLGTQVMLVIKILMPMITDGLAAVLFAGGVSESDEDLLRRAQTAVFRREFKQAEDLYKQYRDNHDHELSAWLRLATFYDEQNRYEDAQVLLKQAYEARSWSKDERALLLYRRAALLADKLSKLDEAETLREELLEEFPKTAYARKLEDERGS